MTINKLNISWQDFFFNCLCVGILTVFPVIASAQTGNYWTRNFNEESSLLSGAVVGGGSGPSAIYFNPASISEVKSSKFSLNASLFSFDFRNIQNALGEEIDLNSTRGIIEPRFISYMIESKRFKNWSFELAFLSNENSWTEFSKSVDQKIDVLTGIPGSERYYAFYQFRKRYRDDWLGTGSSVRLSDHLSAGISLFVTIKSMDYYESLDIETYPLEGGGSGLEEPDNFYIAAYERSEYVKFNDYRLTWKAGLLYQTKNYSLGLSITTPSLGGIYSDGKKVNRRQKQSNITSPETGESLTDYLIVDYKEKEDVNVNNKTPFSVAAGMNYYFPDRRKILFTTFEYFGKLQPYRLVEASETVDILPSFFLDKILFSDWLTIVSGAKPVFNVALGYSSKLKEGLLMMFGFRTDFHSGKDLDYRAFSELNRFQVIPIDIYHLSCGFSWNIFGQDLITGIQYTTGHVNGQQQIANLSEPVEYNTIDKVALQGVKLNTMNAWYNAFSFYLGASLNFGPGKDQ